MSEPLRFQCPDCKDIIIPDDSTTHQMQRCSCKKIGIDAEEHYIRVIGNAITLHPEFHPDAVVLSETGYKSLGSEVTGMIRTAPDPPPGSVRVPTPDSKPVGRKELVDVFVNPEEVDRITKMWAIGTIDRTIKPPVPMTGREILEIRHVSKSISDMYPDLTEFSNQVRLCDEIISLKRENHNLRNCAKGSHPVSQWNYEVEPKELQCVFCGKGRDPHPPDPSQEYIPLYDVAKRIINYKGYVDGMTYSVEFVEAVKVERAEKEQIDGLSKVETWADTGLCPSCKKPVDSLVLHYDFLDDWMCEPCAEHAAYSDFLGMPD